MNLLLPTLSICLGLSTALLGQGRGAGAEVFTMDEALHKKTIFLNKEFLVFSAELKDSKEKLPIVIYLHGAGGTGEQIRKITGQTSGLHRAIARFGHGPCFVVAPQCQRDHRAAKGGWIADELDLLLEHLKATLPIDESRIYLTGNSMGGYGTWMWAGTKPEHFAAIAPMVGGIGHGGPTDVTPDFDTWIANLVKVPVWAFAGALDKVVPAERSERVIKAVKAAGHTNARITVYPDKGHNAGQSAYQDAKFFKWLFSQKREAAE